MSYTLIIQNNTSGAIVANGILINQGTNNSSQDATVNIQVPFQGVLQVKYLNDDKVIISSAFYKNEIGYDGQGITLSINQNFEFSVDGTAIQNVPIQTNRIANYPFQPLESTDLPDPWEINFPKNEVLIKSLNAQELNFSAHQQSGGFATFASLPTIQTIQGVQINFKLQVDAFARSNDYSQTIYLPGQFLQLSFDLDGQGFYSSANEQIGTSSIRIGDGIQHEICIIVFSNASALIEDGIVRYHDIDQEQILTPKFGFGAFEGTQVPEVNFTFSDIEIGTPHTLDDSNYAFSGMGNLWSANYVLSSNYYCTNWMRCDHLIAAIQYDKNDSSNNQAITIVDMNTGGAIIKNIPYAGKAYRSPFVDEEFKYICFPINNRYYYIYDLNIGDFIQEDAIDLDPGSKYSEEVCYKGNIYFASYDKNWHIYDIASGSKSTHSFDTSHDIKRIVKPIVYDSVIFAAMYTEHNGTYTEIIASTINADGSLSNKWHKKPHESSNTQIWSKYISYDGLHLYYWDANIDLFAINLSDGSEAWINTDYHSTCNEKGYYFAPTTNQLGALYIIKDNGEIISLSPDNGKTTGTSDKPFHGKTYNINECCLSAYIAIYPNDDHTPYSLCSIPKIVNGHYTCQGNDSKTLYSVNLDTGIIQSAALDSNCYVSNFSPNIVTSSYDSQGLNLIQVQQYDKNFYFDSALMAEEYERDAKSDTIRPKTTDNSFYAVTVSLQSNDGVPINNVVYIKNMGEQVTIISSLFEGGQGEVTLAPKEQVAIKPEFDGKFTFKIPATSLYCPALHFWSDFMLPNVRVAFFANQSNVDVLRNQTTEDVLNAKSYVGLDGDAEQCYVFEDDFRNQDDADLITQMIANSVGGSILDDDAQVSALNKKEFSVKSISEKAQQKNVKEERIRRRAAIKQDVLSAGTYTPNLTMDYCAFADDNTDNCLCTNDPGSPIIDQPYLSDESTYTSGEFVIVNDDLRGPSQNILYDADRDKIKWRKANQLFEEQINDYLVETPTLTREDVEEDIYGFRAFVNDCIKSDEQVQSFHWEPQDEGVQKGIKKVFHVVITAGEKIFRFIVNTMEQGLMVLESFFKQVAKSIIDVVQWLSWVLNWQDILNCQKNLSTSMSNNFKKGLDYFSFNQEAWIGKVNSFIDNVEESVDQAFNTAESAIGGYNMDDITQEYNNPRTLTGEGGDNVTNQMNYFNDQLGVPTGQAEYAQYKRSYLKYKRLKRFGGNEVAYLENLHPKISRMIQLQEDSAGNDSLQDFFEAIASEIDKYIHIFENLFTQLKDQIDDEIFQAASEKASAIMYAFRTKVNTPQEFLQTCMVVLLDLLKSFIDFALEACRLLITDLIRLIPQFIDSIITIMEKPINAPGITDLWNFIVGDDEDLTVLNFTSLLIALPMTLSMQTLGYGDNIFFRENGIVPLAQEKLTESDEREIIIGVSSGAAVAALFYAGFDFIIDELIILQEPEELITPTPLVVSILFFDISVVGLTFPTYTDTSSVYPADYTAWSLGAAHWIMELVFAVKPNYSSDWAETGYAVAFEITSLVSMIGKLTSDDDYGSNGDIIFLFFHNTAYMLPELFKPLRLISANPYAKGILLGTDFLCGGANAFMFIYYIVNAEETLVIEETKV